jgi:hypothetical protein
MVLAKAMSEFKFACPVCGQHITAASKSSGTQLECPTCFQKIIIPQAPASAFSKLILSASRVGKPRPVQMDGLQHATPIPARRMSLISFAIWGLVVCAAAGAIYKFRENIVSLVRRAKPDSPPHTTQTTAGSRTFYPIPTNTAWTMNLSKAVIPDERVAGGIRGTGFLCERATLQGGNLTLRQGRTWPPDLGISVILFAKQGEELSGKTLEVSPDRTPPLPKIVLRWKDEQDQYRKEDFTSGYALKMIFGDAVNARIPGKIFLALPDEGKSFVAGSFEAEIRKPPPPKPSHP